MRVKGEEEKKAPVVDRPVEVRFNGENLHGVFHHFKVWLHEVCRSGVSAVKIKNKSSAICLMSNLTLG